MMSFYLSGGVEVLGFISPTEPTDEYPVIDPLYGIDGFRNVDTLSELNSIPNLRRRAGMVVGVSGGTQYYKLNLQPWNGTITDWDTFSLGGGTFTGGTVTGDTIFTQGVTATTFSASTYLGLPLDVFVTGGTYSNGTLTFTNNSGETFNVVGLYTGGTDFYVTGGTFNKNTETLTLNRNDGNNVQVTGFTDIFTTGFTFNPSTYNISIERNDGVTLTQNLGILATDVTITGGTYDPLNGSITFVNNTGGTFTVSGFITGFTDIQVTGYTYQDNTFTISDSSGNTFSATIDVMTGLTINGDLIVTGTTSLQGFSATTISATTIGTSGDCVDDIYVSNIHSCSPLNINPLDEGNVYFGSTSGVTIDLTNNRVGIGTSLPQETLHISGTSRFDNDVTIWDDGVFNGNSRKLYFRGLGQTGNTQSGEIYLDAYGNTNDEVLELRSGGGVRLGATGIDGTIQVFNFASNYPIIQSVQTGGLGFNVNSTTNGFTFYQGYAQTTGDLFSIYNSGPTKAFSILASNSNVGIGNITPSAKLHINNTTSSNTFLAEDSTNPDSSPFVIDASGNTGIGTTTPTAKLSISGNTHLSGETRYYISNVLYDGFIRPASSLSGLILELGSSSSGTHIQILPSNRTFFYQSTYFTTTPTINFGVSIGDRLTINNGIYTGSTNTLIWAGNNANSNIFKIQGDSKIAINKPTALAALDISGDTLVSGSLGIGTTTPSEKLDVSGKTKTINLQITSGATAGYVLTSDASGNATWQVPTVTADTYTTGFTYQDNTFTISDSSGNTLNATINSVTGLTVNGILSASTISGGTLYGDGSNLTGLSTGLNVGTTQITNGTDTRVLFQSGTTLQQDGNFTFNPTLKRLTLKAIGAGTSDTPFIIQNSTGTVNLLEQNGVGSLLARSNDTFSYLGLFYRSDGANGWTLTNSHSGFGLGTGIETVGNNLYFLTTGTRALSVSTQGTGTFKTYGIWNYGSGSGQRLLIGENVFDPQLTLSGLGNLGLGTYSAGARLDVRAQGALSTDIVFRVRNSADSQNLISIHGDGRFLIGQNASNTCTGGFPQYAIAIGFGANVSGQSENYSSPIAIGYDAQSVGLSSIGIGNSVRPGTGIAIGHGVQSRAESVAIGGSTTNARGTVIGSGSSNTGYGGSAIGYDVDNTGDGSFLIGYFHTNSIASSFVWGNNGIKFLVNSNSNIVLANNKPITEANKSTYFDTSATNTITISTGTTPSTNIVDSAQIYVTDRGGTAGRASAHFRSEDGTINVLGDRTGINTSTPQARLHVANADTTLTTGLFSGTGQNILTVIGSGNTTSSPIFTVQGSSGELFSVSDSLVGSLFSVNDISGLPILEVFSDNTTLMGSYLAPSLNTTSRVIATTGTTNVYSIPTSAYTGAFFDYTVSDGTNLRAGNIMSIWSGTSVNITETQTTDFGNTSGLTFNMVVSSGNAILRTSGTTGNWTVKTIVRSI